MWRREEGMQGEKSEGGGGSAGVSESQITCSAL